MTDSATLNSIEAPQTIYLRDYQVPPYLIDQVDLNVDIHDDVTEIRSTLQVRRNPDSQQSSHDLTLNGEELQLVSIALNQTKLNTNQYTIHGNFLTIANVPDTFTLEIITKAQPEKNTALSGLYRSATTYCTQCEAEGFRRITYFLDRPDVLSQYTTTITADAKKYPYLLSNGNLIASGKTDDGRHFAKWEDPFKKPCYLFALVAGDFDVVEDTFKTLSKRDVAVRVYAEKGYGDQVAHAVYSAQQAMKWDEEVYGREYDLDAYMIVAIGDFNMGAMENKGLNIFNTKYALAKPSTATDDDYTHILSVVAHEYFHNWTGNRVTCRDWFQLSLKEGLTIFRDQSFSEDLLSRAVMRIRDVNDLREAQFPEDAGPLAHPVRPDSYIEINNFYTATVYNKGAEVLRMLRTIIGADLYRKGMDLYFERFDGQAVTIEDYVQCMQDVSGVNLGQFKHWYSQAGTPVVMVSDDYDPQKQRYTLRMTQVTPATPGQSQKQALHIPVQVGLLDDKGGEMMLYCDGAAQTKEMVLHLQEATQAFVFNNVTSRPIPSLLRNFSAPIKLQYDYTDSDLLFLFKHDKDEFNRWEAGQRYATRLILNLVRDYRQDKALQVPDEYIAVFADLLQHAEQDKLLAAEMLMLPSEKYIGEQMEVIDVDAIHAAREFVLDQLALRLETSLLTTYRQFHDAGVYKFSMDDVGKRQLKNRCLILLMRLPQHAEMGLAQFASSLESNMTDTLAALSGLVNADTSLRAKALDQYYQAWKQDALVMDKWFGLQAVSKLPDALKQIKKLLQHECFDIKNPNKVYALIGAFGQRNPVNFHARSGEGYAFLREVVQQLDKLNPQVAARMVKPLTSWKRYDKERQTLMRQQLEHILRDEKLSPDVYELVTKSLES